MMSPPSPTPLETIPSSVAHGRTNELSVYTPPRTTTIAGTSRGSGPYQGPIPTSTKTMAHGNTNTHRLSSDFYTSAYYQANLIKFKEDLYNAIKSKLGVDMGSSHLYQKTYPPEFNFVSYPVGWRVPEFIKFNGDDTRTIWEHGSQYILQLGEASFNDALHVSLFSLSLTGMAFSWFSSLASNSIQNWNLLEYKFHDHFFIGETEEKFSDLTSVRHGQDEPAYD